MKPQPDQYRQRNRSRRIGIDKRQIERDAARAIRVRCRRHVHSIKVKGKLPAGFDKYWNCYHVSAFRGRTISMQEMQNMIASATAHVTFSDEQKPTEKAAEQRKPPRPGKKQRKAAQRVDESDTLYQLDETYMQQMGFN